MFKIFISALYVCSCSWGCLPICLVLVASSSPIRGSGTLQGDFTAEEHLEEFYSYAENINIEQEDVWTRVFVQSLDG